MSAIPKVYAVDHRGTRSTVYTNAADEAQARDEGADVLGVPRDQVTVREAGNGVQSNLDGDVAELGDPSGLKGQAWVDWHERSFKLPRPCGCDLSKRRLEWLGVEAVCLECGMVVNEVGPSPDPKPRRRDQGWTPELTDSPHEQAGSALVGTLGIAAFLVAVGFLVGVVAVVAWRAW